MDYVKIINDLIAFCQREGVLSTESETLYNQLEGITDYYYNREDFEEII